MKKTEESRRIISLLNKGKKLYLIPNHSIVKECEMDLEESNQNLKTNNRRTPFSD